MAEKRYGEVEVFVMVDEAGDYVVHKDRDELAQAFTDDIGSCSTNFRTIAIKLKVELPEDVVLTAEVPYVAGAVEMKVS